jgi:hypothetical protein
MAGYSGTPLGKKLGIKPGFSMYMQNVPEDYFDWISPLPDNVLVRESLTGELDFVHLFIKDQNTFIDQLLKAKRHLTSDGMIWASWPKKSSGVASDLDENIIRDYGLKIGLVDIKVCAVNEIWSGLKFVIPVRNR